jgi:hypothetical protein
MPIAGEAPVPSASGKNAPLPYSEVLISVLAHTAYSLAIDMATEKNSFGVTVEALRDDYRSMSSMQTLNAMVSQNI